jgi:hypothetical protein
VSSAFEAAFWGLVGGGALVLGAAIGYLVQRFNNIFTIMTSSAILPENTGDSHGTQNSTSKTSLNRRATK